MIERMSVSGVGGIVSAELEFRGQFVAITGESGAGKSSLVRAFELICGRRAQSTSINAGEGRSEVAAEWSAEGDLPELSTRRVITRSGKNRTELDGVPAPVSALAAETALRMEIQSQFAQLDLLSADKQMELVDRMGGEALSRARTELRELFPRMMKLERDMIELRRRRSVLALELDGADDRVRRIRRLDLDADSERSLETELAELERRLANAERNRDLVERLRGGEEGVSLIDRVGSVLRDLYDAAPEAERDRWEALGESAMSDLDELLSAASRTISLELPEEIEVRRDEVEQRLGEIRKLRRETGARDAAELAEWADSAEEEIAWLAASAGEAEAMSTEITRVRAEVANAARELRTLRTEAAGRFETAVNGHLRDLAMEGSEFRAEIVPSDRVRATGAEMVSFTLSSGGLPPTPVARAASGGELSRILIAIRASISDVEMPGSLVFDEVEAGLGGRAALLAGQKLRELSKKCRVILITHDAAIAAMADTHFLVRRYGSTTEVSQIYGEEREAEIARMLSGSPSPEAIRHARVLLRG